jgi:hypothetical protein
MSEFHPLYQFIPVTGKINGNQLRSEFDAIRAGTSDTFARHDLWQAEGFSGRIVCRLHLCTPTIIGAQQQPGSEQQAGDVEQYQRQGKPAIPGNSLRGMLASVMETLSQSALRVLEERPYSVRKTASKDEVLTEMGELTWIDERWHLRPLRSIKVPSRSARPLFARAQREQGGVERPLVYARIEQGQLGAGNSLLTRDEWDKLPPQQQQNYTQGHIHGYPPSDQLFDGRDHERFVYPAGGKPISLPPMVLERFQQIVEQQQESSRKASIPLPLLRLGQSDWQLREGMVLYYKRTGGPVDELAPSAIWRAAIPGDSHQFFRNIDPDLLPWGKGGRTALTPAEQLLGVVAGEKGEEQPHSTNLASRLRIHDALPAGEIRRLPETTLRILASPKPPSPAMYFHPNGRPGEWQPKAKLAPQKNAPNGRKYYVHHAPNQDTWSTGEGHRHSNLKQKLRCRPMESGQDFWFTIAFDNLSKAELQLLRTAIEPSDDFQHRLGLGKALGLGSVKLAAEALLLSDRKARYACDGLRTPRYAHCLRGQGCDPNAWPQALSREADAVKQAAPWPEPQALKDDRLIDRATLAKLLVVGDPAALREGIPVMHPLTQGQSDPEDETFQWFVQNDRAGHQALQPIRPGHKLPTLERTANQPPEPPQWQGAEIPEDGAPGSGDSAALDWLEERLAEIEKDNRDPAQRGRAAYGKPLANVWRDKLADQPELQAGVRELIKQRWGEEWNAKLKRGKKAVREIYGNDESDG